MQSKRLIIGSRSSKLALVQAEFVKKEFKRFYPELEIEIKTIKTTGDKILDVALSKIGDKGLFTKEIDQALLGQEIDLAVHSMKDIPTEIHKDLEITAVTKRENPCDILVSAQRFNLRTLPKNSKVGTSSLRRRAQLLSIRPDLEIINLRGNLDTRIKKLESGLFDAIVVACAGVKRLGVKVGSSIIPAGHILPQAGQGSLGIEARKNNHQIKDLIKRLDSPSSRFCIEAERAFLSVLGGGCQVPIGVYAKIEDEKIIIKGGVFSLDGKKAIKDEISGDKKRAVELGKELAEKLLKKGASKILEELNIISNS